MTFIIKLVGLAAQGHAEGVSSGDIPILSVSALAALVKLPTTSDTSLHDIIVH